MVLKNGRVLPMPPKYTDPGELQQKIDEFFVVCEEKKKPPTITGLAVYLGTTRDWLRDWEIQLREKKTVNAKTRDDISRILRMAKERIHASIEELLLSGKNPIGAIFNLKNNFGWKDKNENELQGGVSISWTDPKKKGV